MAISPADVPNVCAACGKEDGGSAGLKACAACKMIKYCDVSCQRAHRPAHKKACKVRAAELHDEALFKEPPAPGDCAICFLPNIEVMGEFTTLHYKTCCGKTVCNGCQFANCKRRNTCLRLL